MKKYCALMIVIFNMFFITAHAETDRITINGMVCAFCAVGIEKSFKKLPAVSSIAVDMDQRLVTITTKEGMTVDESTIREIIKDAGFDTVSIERVRS